MGWITKFTALRFFLGGIETYIIQPTAWSYIRSLGQSKTFLALVLSSYDIGCVISGPLIGAITDRWGDPRLISICCCAFKVLAYAMYSVNLNAYFPLLGRFMSGLSGGITAILLGQVALQTDEKSRGENFIFLEGVYCIGSAFGPMFGSFISFDVNILGFEINDNNSPGIILAIMWLLFLIFSIFLPSGTWMVTGAHVRDRDLPSSNDEEDKRLTVYHQDGDRRLTETEKPFSMSSILDSRILCLFFLIFCSEVFSSTATFYVPIFGIDHFHLHLIHIKLLFLNCTLFTLLVFLSFHVASDYVNERKLFLIALLMQIIAISFLTVLAFSWDDITTAQFYYILLIYVCFGMPYFAYPFGNSILSKIVDSQNATFVQGVSYGTLHVAIVLSRVVASFMFTKVRLVSYCIFLVILWFFGIIWYGIIILYPIMV